MIQLFLLLLKTGSVLIATVKKTQGKKFLGQVKTIILKIIREKNKFTHSLQSYDDSYLVYSVKEKKVHNIELYKHSYF